jgi:hypothetical protein
MCDKKKYESLVHFDKDDETSVFSRAMDIAAMKLDADELDDHLASIGVTREELELIGADCLLDDSVRRTDDWDDSDDNDGDNW